MAPSSTIGFGEVQELLVKGGYFRARIQALPPFDVVAGGLAWCIRNSRFTIDVEFVENAEIRDKIRAAENICAALHDRMHSPHPLEPHQIQGLDYPKLYVVLQWLMKRVAATREENAYFVKEYTRQDFRRKFGTNFPGTHTVKFVRPKPAPTRVMISSKEEYTSAVEHASAVMLEYGMQALVKDSVLMLKSNGAELEGDAEAQQEHQKLEEDEKKEAAMLEQLMGQMVKHKEKNRMSTSSIGQVLATADSNKLAKLRDSYQQRKAALLAQLQEEEAERNELEHQKERTEELKGKVGELAEEANRLSEATDEYRSECDAAKKAADSREVELAAEEARVDEYERVIRGDPQQAEQLDQIIELRHSIARETKNLKDQKSKAKKEIATIKAECEGLAAKLDVLTSAEHSEVAEKERTKYEELKKSLVEQLRETTLEMTNLLRKIDQYPTRLELKQYETRIDELNEEVAWKFEETKLMFAMHNTRTEVSRTLVGEHKVFESVSEAFISCVNLGPKKAASQRATLLEQVEAVIGQLADAQTKQRNRMASEQEQLSTIRTEYTTLMEAQKKYFDSVAAFKEKVALMADITPAERAALYGEEEETPEEDDDLADL